MHKARIDVKEDGDDTVRSKIKDHSSVPPALKPFNCNRPFFYMILDLQTSSILYMGLFRHPVVRKID